VDDEGTDDVSPDFCPGWVGGVCDATGGVGRAQFVWLGRLGFLPSDVICIRNNLDNVAMDEGRERGGG
jgi:hypothetical protein